MAGLVEASFSSRSPMLWRVRYFPSFPASGESLTEARTEMTGGSIGVQAMLGTLLCETKVWVHRGVKPVTLTETMSPATAFLIGSRETPCTTVMSLTLPDARTSPAMLLDVILSPFWTCPLKTLPVTVGPRAGRRSICETSMEKPRHFSSTATMSGLASTGFGGRTWSRMVSYSASMLFGRLSDLASSRDLQQKPTLPEAYNVG
mmetsp:Transcript_53504/g.148338  ORF Transcript_53504/g.148338 Transcript_53504/m.148338 type:complete len:204 (+) Transcript_53504:909-1520(+)